MGCEKETNCLRVNARTRGAVPQKVSDLVNDVPYVSRDELEKTLVDVGAGYKGISNDSADILIDNLARTIEVVVKDQLRRYFPVDQNTGLIPDGNYTLSAMVSGGEPTYIWSTGAIQSAPYYHGWTKLEVANLTAEDILSLERDDSTKSDKEYTFHEASQARVVMAYPASYGTLSKIVYLAGGMEFNVIDIFDIVNLVINDTPYLVYVSHDTDYLDDSGQGIVYKFIY